MIIVRKINEGIAHLEDLPIDKFLATIKKLPELTATEKLDGSELVVGFDSEGKLYTTRSYKGGKSELFYSSTEYWKSSGGPTFATAHKVLSKVESILAKHIKSGEAVEIEVIFGRQPNAVTYGLEGKNYIVFLRAVPGTNQSLTPRSELPNELQKALANKEITVHADVKSSADGKTLQDEKIVSTWKFSNAQKVSVDSFKNEVAGELKKLEEFLKQENDDAKKVGLTLTNFEVSMINLSKIKTDKREAIKTARENVNTKITSEFKLPIKEKMLSTFRQKVKSNIQAPEVSSSEYADPEGLVFTDQDTGEQIKLVDKDEFTAVNKFNFGIRKKLSGVVRTIDQNADIESRGGITGVLKYRIMNLLGIPEATRTFQLKKLLASFDGSSPEDTLEKFADGFKSVDFNAYKRKISAMIDYTLTEIDHNLDDFKKNHQSFKLKLKNGNEIGYTDEIVRRTLLSFAETRDHLKEFLAKIRKSTNVKDMLAAIIGDTNEQIFTESALIFENAKSKTNSKLNHLKHKDIHDIMSTYFVNYLAAIILVRFEDAKTLKLLKDENGGRLKIVPTSYFNQLGYIVYHPESEFAKQYISEKTASALKKYSGRILQSRINHIHNDISSKKSKIIDWYEVDHNIRLLAVRFEIHEEVATMARVIFDRWYDSTLDDKNALLTKIYYRLQAVDAESPFLDRLKYALENFLKNANKENAMLIKEIQALTNKLVEDGDGGSAAVARAADASATVSASVTGVEPNLAQPNASLVGVTSSKDIATHPKRLFKGKIIRRIPRKIQKRKKQAKTKNRIKQGI